MFMTGTYSRLGAGSPVMLLDAAGSPLGSTLKLVREQAAGRGLFLLESFLIFKRGRKPQEEGLALGVVDNLRRTLGHPQLSGNCALELDKCTIGCQKIK
jgi:hypothetical protein